MNVSTILVTVGILCRTPIRWVRKLVIISSHTVLASNLTRGYDRYLVEILSVYKDWKRSKILSEKGQHSSFFKFFFKMFLYTYVA